MPDEKEYCICCVPLRRMVDSRGMNCNLCHKLITDETYRHFGWIV